MPKVHWLEEFQSSYRVPHEISRLVEAGIIEDVSFRLDSSPSFGAKLRDKNWVRLWVEYPHVDHPGANLRKGWPDRYTVVIQPDPTVPFGLRVLGTEDIGLALWCVTQIMRTKTPAWRFKIEQKSRSIS